VPPYRYSQAVQFVEPNALDSPSLPVGKDNGRAYKFGVGLLELTEDGRRADFTDGMGVPELELNDSVFASERCASRDHHTAKG